MKALIALFILSALPVTSAHALPQEMSQALAEAKQAYAETSKKDADELRERNFDEPFFLASVGMGGMWEAIQADKEVIEYQKQTVKDLAWTFKLAQLNALLEATRESSAQFNSDSGSVQRDITILELALRFKKNDLSESGLEKEIAKIFSKTSES